MILTKEAILAASDVPREEVEVPEWGGTVIVSGLTGYGREQFEAAVAEGKKTGNVTNLFATMAALTIVDAEGHRLFALEETAMLGEKSREALVRVVSVATRLSGMEVKAVEEMAENLPDGQGGSSSSA